MNAKLNDKISAVFHNLKNYASYLIMQELDKFNLKISVTLNRLEKYMSFSINNKLIVIESSQFLSSPLDSLVKNWAKDDFKYSSQEFDNNVLDLVKQKGSWSWLLLKSLKNNYQAKKNFIVRSQVTKNMIKVMEQI